MVVVAIHDAPVWEHDPGADETIAGQSVRASEQTDPAAEGEAGDADRGTAPGRQGPAAGVQRRVHLSQAGAGPDRGNPVICHENAIEARQVEHDPVRRRSAREAVPPATWGDAVPGGCRVRQGAGDVRNRAAQNHEPGAHLPVGGVDRAADRFVAGRVRAEQLAVEGGAELGQVGHEFEPTSGVTTGS
jgi:hypothetical protein